MAQLKSTAEKQGINIANDPVVQDIIDSFPFYVMLVDENHHIVMANEKVKDVLGVNPKEIIGQHCARAIHGIDGRYDGCPLEESMEKGGCAVEKEIFEPKLGRWFKSAIYPTDYRTEGGKKIFVHMTHDITAQKEAEEEIRHNYDIQSAANAILRLSLQDITTEQFLQKALELILGIPWLVFERKGCIFLADENSGSLVMVAQHGLTESIRNACARLPFGKCICGQAAVKRELQFVNKIDKRHEISYENITPHGHYCNPILLNNKTVGVINLYIKESHPFSRKEKEFLDAISNTLAGVIQRHVIQQEKEKMQGQLIQAQKIEAIGTLAGGVAHDFNNILAAISGNAQLIRMNLSPENENYQLTQAIESSSQRGATLTRKLLDFTRKATTMTTASINLNETINEVIELLKRTIEKNAVITLNLAPSLHNITGDPSQIYQSILNLCINARDAIMERGKGEIIIETCNKDLSADDIKLYPKAQPGRYVMLAVSDTGIGMDQETVRHIFEPFFTTKPIGKGSGLGLSVTYGIIKSHNGFVTVYSEKNIGTSFKIYFPANGGQAAAKQEAPKRETALAKGKGSVLIADDEEPIRKMAKTLLERAGYEAVIAADGEKAFEIYRQQKNRFDMVLLDLIMPGWSGLDTLKAMKKINPKVKVLISSGYSSDGTNEEIINLGINGFIQKPYIIKELLEEIKRIMAQ
ncbi:MAG: response regulator [Planctomycetes bacterium]|nr:response regulator [Planctomycetota bacterium]